MSFHMPDSENVRNFGLDQHGRSEHDLLILWLELAKKRRGHVAYIDDRDTDPNEGNQYLTYLQMVGSS